MFFFWLDCEILLLFCFAVSPTIFETFIVEYASICRADLKAFPVAFAVFWADWPLHRQRVRLGGREGRRGRRERSTGFQRHFYIALLF